MAAATLIGFHSRRRPYLTLAVLSFGFLSAACDASSIPSAQASQEPEVAQAEQGLTVGYAATSEPGVISSTNAFYGHNLQLTYGGTCTFRTVPPTNGASPLGDPEMTLYDSANNVLAYNDDDGDPAREGTTHSAIVIALPPGNYRADVNSVKANRYGSYTFEAKCEPLVKLHHRFETTAGGDTWQCNTYNWGTMEAGIGEWTPQILIDADNRVGGCLQTFGITDPTNSLSGLNINLNFWSDGDPGQCWFQSSKAIPISTSTSVIWRDYYVIDTGSSSGGCWQEFTLTGRTDIAFDIEFLATGNADQCNNFGNYTIKNGESVRFRINTDGRAGGCTQRFRLRKL
ncbi:hypothetical protein [Archangium lansingense]|uniref:Lipoprotein n=1 Tax=Archangium lansingense TaxID=2995310 RepID=A0ABT4A242_9BACT|nr:hypothetical protein [Archangium lansinium]MCY1075710.1 hypothetical protein [Archangium lansinium]